MTEPQLAEGVEGRVFQARRGQMFLRSDRFLYCIGKK